MKKIYFIQKNLNSQPKNKLDQALQEAFARWNNHTINEDNVEMFDILFQDVVNKYKADGGKCKVWKYLRDSHGSLNSENRTIHIHVSDSCSYVLIPILGEISLQNHKQ